MLRFTCIVLFFPLIAFSQQKDTARVRVLLELCQNNLFKENKLDSCLLLVKQAEAMSMALHDPKSEGNAALMASKVYRMLKQPEKGAIYLKKAFAIFTKYDYKNEIGEAWVESGDYYPHDDEGIVKKTQ